MKNKLLSCALSLLLLLGMLAPTLSEVFCSESCTGGACDADETEFVCDLKAVECCEAEPASIAEPLTPKAGASLLLSDCLPCPCFSDDEIQGFIVTDRLRGSAANQNLAVCPRVFARLIPIGFEYAVLPSTDGSPTHGPPVYLLGHSLLI